MPHIEPGPDHRVRLRGKAILCDAGLLIYFLLVVHRVFLPSPTGSVSWKNSALLSLIGVGIGCLWNATGTSFGCRMVDFRERKPRHGRYVRRIFGATTLILTFVAGWLITKASASDFLDKDGLIGAGRIFFAMLNPRWAIFNDALSAIVETVYIAFMSTVLAVVPAFFISFLAAKNLMSGRAFGRTVYVLMRAWMNLFRSIEPLIWAIVFSVWVGIGPFAGMLALMVNSIAGLVKLYSEQIENIDEGLIVAIRSTGASSLHVLWFAVVPQIAIPFLGLTIYRWDVNVRMATVIGLVGGGGIGTLLMQYQGLAKWNEVGLIVMMISIVVWLMDFVSAKIRSAVS